MRRPSTGGNVAQRMQSPGQDSRSGHAASTGSPALGGRYGYGPVTGCPVLGSRNSAGLRPPFPKSNIPPREPAMDANDPGMRPNDQLFWMNAVIDDWSVS